MVATEPTLRLISVPFNAAGLTSGVAQMPGVLRKAGLVRALSAVAKVDVGEVRFPVPVPGRGLSGFLAEAALVGMVRGVAKTAHEAWRLGEVPLVIAGDCPALLGGLMALDGAGGGGLVFVDGHEDAWTPWQSPTGEASDSEIALALGLTPAPAGLTEALPCLSSRHTLMLGPRDRSEIAESGAASLADDVRLISGPELVGSDFSRLDRELRRTAGEAPAGWWLHVDLDVLSSEALAAVDYPQPGGLSWEELTELTNTVLKLPNCRGASVAIYNPDLDDGAAASRINQYLVALASWLIQSTSP